MPSYLLMSLGILFWTVGALTYITPFWVARNILLIGGVNLVLLLVIDGTIRLVSKLVRTLEPEVLAHVGIWVVERD